MNIKRKKEGTTLSVSVNGRIDTAINYVSSAGLRVLLSLHKKMLAQGEMKLIHVNEAVSDVFEVTGFDEILNYETGG